VIDQIKAKRIESIPRKQIKGQPLRVCMR